LFDLLSETDCAVSRLWPDQFKGLVESLSTDLHAWLEAGGADADRPRVPFAVLADWCRDHGEQDLAIAFRLFSRPDVSLSKSKESHFEWWRVKGLPKVAGGDPYGKSGPLAWLNAVVAAAESVAQARKELGCES